MKTNKHISSKKIGLVLGSGSARGWAHIGVIQALAEAGIRVDYVAGTSIGALVGAFYAAGKIETLMNTILELDRKQIALLFDMVFPKSGLIDGKKIADSVREHISEKNIEELSLPLCVVCTDLNTGCEVNIQDGDIIEAIRASISVPGIFTPVKKKGAFLVDGGLVNPVPVNVSRQMGADLVIAVDLNHDIVENRNNAHSKSRPTSPPTKYGRFIVQNTLVRNVIDTLNKQAGTPSASILAQIKQWMKKDPAPNIFEVLASSIYIMEMQITATRLKTEPPDILIQPKLGHIRFLDFHRAQEAIDEGYREARIRIATFMEKKA